MVNIKIDFDIKKLTKDMSFYVDEVDKACRKSVFKMSKEIMEPIIEQTAGPAPAPKVKYYQRTGRWLGGWANAANYLGISLRLTKDTPRIVLEAGHAFTYNDPEENSFRAVNDVLYAEYIERTGTWKSPYPSRRKAYRYVADKIENEQTEQRFADIIQENLANIE